MSRPQGQRRKEPRQHRGHSRAGSHSPWETSGSRRSCRPRIRDDSRAGTDQPLARAALPLTRLAPARNERPARTEHRRMRGLGRGGSARGRADWRARPGRVCGCVGLAPMRCGAAGGAKERSRRLCRLPEQPGQAREGQGERLLEVIAAGGRGVGLVIVALMAIVSSALDTRL